MPVPPARIFEAISGPETHVLRSVDIYEEDAYTPFLLNVGVISGKVSVDASRDERRTMDLELENIDGQLDHYPGGFWYDKVIKCYRGVKIGKEEWKGQIGEFLIDDIASAAFPSTVSVTGRDYTKKLLEDEFPGATTFEEHWRVEAVIEAIAYNARVPKHLLPVTGKTLGRSFEFEAGTTRWQAIKDIATAFGLEIFFDPSGWLTMREMADPATSPLSFTFHTGAVGNLAGFTKKASSARLYNVVVVTGKDPATDLPIVAVAENHSPGSPASIEALGRRKVYRYTSEFMTTLAQCQDVADKFLRVHGLEQFEVALESLVFPWLEVGEIIEFVDPSPAPGDPTRFLLHNLEIPMDLGVMTVTAKRVQLVLEPAVADQNVYEVPYDLPMPT